MATDKTDGMIREKMEQLGEIPGGPALDKQRSWERMRFRLDKPASQTISWWKYAAAILVLISGTYGVIHYLGSTNRSGIPSGNLSSQVEKRVPVDTRQTIKQTPPTAALQKRAKKVQAKTDGPEKKPEQRLITQSGNQPIISRHTVPVVPAAAADTPNGSNPLIAKDHIHPPDEPRLHPLTGAGQPAPDERPEHPPVTTAVSQKLPIVYYKALVQTGTPGPEDLHPPAKEKFSVRWTAGDGSGDHFLATRRRSGKPFSIQLSPR